MAQARKRSAPQAERDRRVALRRFKAEVFQALAHPTRIHIAECLEDGERSVSTLVERIGIEPANLSQHLAILRPKTSHQPQGGHTSILRPSGSPAERGAPKHAAILPGACRGGPGDARRAVAEGADGGGGRVRIVGSGAEAGSLPTRLHGAHVPRRCDRRHHGGPRCVAAGDGLRHRVRRSAAVGYLLCDRLRHFRFRRIAHQISGPTVPSSS